MNPLAWTILLGLEYLSQWNMWEKMRPASAAATATATEVEAKNLVAEEAEGVQNQDIWTALDTHG